MGSLESIRSELFKADRQAQSGMTPLGGRWAAGDTLIAGVCDRECACVEVSVCVFTYRK